MLGNCVKVVLSLSLLALVLVSYSEASPDGIQGIDKAEEDEDSDGVKRIEEEDQRSEEDGGREGRGFFSRLGGLFGKAKGFLGRGLSKGKSLWGRHGGSFKSLLRGGGKGQQKSSAGLWKFASKILKSRRPPPQMPQGLPQGLQGYYGGYQ